MRLIKQHKSSIALSAALLLASCGSNQPKPVAEAELDIVEAVGESEIAVDVEFARDIDDADSGWQGQSDQGGELQGPPKPGWTDKTQRYISEKVRFVSKGVDSWISQDASEVEDGSYLRLRLNHNFIEVKGD